MVGQLISHFKVIKKLGCGGMGDVYLCEDVLLKRKAVLKLLSSETAANTHVTSRFKREAQSAGTLRHPNIVTIYELGERDGALYIAMEHIEGTVLSDLMESKEVPIRKAIDVCIQIARGLRCAHQVGVIHRDIKPDNIMVDREGWIKILDFGLAKLTGVSNITRIGTRLGTIPYMSPEQLRGNELDRRSDIYSLGVVLYQLITNRLPFQGDSEEKVMYSVLHKNPEPLARYKTGVSSGLQRIIHKALDKDFRLRYQYVDDLLSDLKRERQIYARRRAGVKRQSRSQEPSEDIIYIRSADIPRKRSNSYLWPAGIVAISLLFFIYNFLAPDDFRARLQSAVVRGTANLEQWLRNKDAHGTEFDAGMAQVSPLLGEIIRIESSGELISKISDLKRQDLIKVGKEVNRAALKNCFIVVVGSKDVVDWFGVKNSHFHSLKSGQQVRSLAEVYPDHKKIWIQLI